METFLSVLLGLLGMGTAVALVVLVSKLQIKLGNYRTSWEITDWEGNNIMEIKFRIYDCENEEMIYGVGITPESDTYIPYRMTGSGERFEDFNYYPESVLMQFLGLKDRNNKDIYDGDLVRITNTNRFFNENINCISKVKVIEGHPYVWLDPVIIGEKKHYGARLLMKGEAKHLRDHVVATSDVEIIGNFFENPELLGGR